MYNTHVHVHILYVYAIVKTEDTKLLKVNSIY